MYITGCADLPTKNQSNITAGLAIWGGKSEKSKEQTPVLPIDTFGGAEVTIGRTYKLAFSLTI